MGNILPGMSLNTPPNSIVVTGNVTFENGSSFTIDKNSAIKIKGCAMHTMSGTYYFKPIEFGIIIRFKTSKSKLAPSWVNKLGPDEEPKLKRLI